MASTKSISTSIGITSCDVCGRTLLRGEQAQIYVDGGARRSVCELCVPRAVHEGWLREGTIPDYDGSADRIDRRRSLLSRWRSRPRREPPPLVEASELEPDEVEPVEPVEPEPAPPRTRQREAARRPAASRAPAPEAPVRGGSLRAPRRVREPRHVRAVPTAAEHRISSAVALFNESEHPRTAAGIARSLGLPEVTVVPAVTGAMVHVVLAWELCWYRYEVDLSDELPSVRVAAQGYELDELAPEERRPNAVADETGLLSLA